MPKHAAMELFADDMLLDTDFDIQDEIMDIEYSPLDSGDAYENVIH